MINHDEIISGLGGGETTPRRVLGPLGEPIGVPRCNVLHVGIVHNPDAIDPHLEFTVGLAQGVGFENGFPLVPDSSGHELTLIYVLNEASRHMVLLYKLKVP